MGFSHVCARQIFLPPLFLPESLDAKPFVEHWGNLKLAFVFEAESTRNNCCVEPRWCRDLVLSRIPGLVTTEATA